MRPLALVLLFASPSFAQERFVERTPAQLAPQAHTMSRAGNSASVAWWAKPSVGKHDRGGSVFGTFGLDFAGKFPGRVFRPEPADPSRGLPLASGYRTDGPHVPDIFAARPVRKAVIEKKEAKEHKPER